MCSLDHKDVNLDFPMFLNDTFVGRGHLAEVGIVVDMISSVEENVIVDNLYYTAIGQNVFGVKGL